VEKKRGRARTRRGFHSRHLISPKEGRALIINIQSNRPYGAALVLQRKAYSHTKAQRTSSCPMVPRCVAYKISLKPPDMTLGEVALVAEAVYVLRAS
jgi:hypothetical protein